MKSKEIIREDQDSREVFCRALAASIHPMIRDCFGAMVEQLGLLSFIAQERPSSGKPTDKQNSERSQV